MDNIETIKYANDRDKCYGVTGMTIALAVWDKEYYIESVSVDRADIDSILFHPEFTYTRNQKLSAKSAWIAMIDHFRIASGMLMANVMCRNIVMERHEPTRNQMLGLLDLIIEEGMEEYQLDEDECRALFNNTYNHLSRVFVHPAVHSVANRMADRLSSRREMLHSEILDFLIELS